MKCPVYKEYLERNIANLAGDDPQYARFLAEAGRSAWLVDQDFEPIAEKIHEMSGNQVVIPGQEFLQLCRYVNDEVTEKILQENQRTQDKRKKDINRVLTKIWMTDFRDLLTKVG